MTRAEKINRRPRNFDIFGASSSFFSITNNAWNKLNTTIANNTTRMILINIGSPLQE